MQNSPDQTTIMVQYNIPRYVLAAPGKQNRACTGEMRITPGVSEPIQFQYCNTDGVPVNLAGFALRLVFWFQQNEYETLAANLANNIVLAKDLSVEDPYAGTAIVLLGEDDTLRLARLGRASLRWSVYLINSDGEVFPTQITASGERFGIAHIDQAEIPSGESIRGTTVS